MPVVLNLTVVVKVPLTMLNVPPDMELSVPLPLVMFRLGALFALPKLMAPEVGTVKLLVVRVTAVDDGLSTKVQLAVPAVAKMFVVPILFRRFEIVPVPRSVRVRPTTVVVFV